MLDISSEPNRIQKEKHHVSIATFFYSTTWTEVAGEGGPAFAPEKIFWGAKSG